MTHIFHDDILHAGLQGDCPRCVELADHPDQLDEVNRARLRAGHIFTDLDRRAAVTLAAWREGMIVLVSESPHRPSSRSVDSGGRPVSESRRDRPFGVPTIMDIHDRMWSELMGREDPFPTERGRPYWRPSSLGYCMRRQYLWRTGLAETRVQSADDKAAMERKFAWGRDVETHVRERMFRAGLLIESSVEVVDESMAVRGQIDFVWGGVVATDLPERAAKWSAPYRWAVLEIRNQVEQTMDGPAPITGTELKSTAGYALSKMVKEGPRFDYRIQAGIYFALAKRHPEQFTVPLDRFEIVVVGRDAMRPVQFEATQEDVDLALERVDALNTAWEAQWTPPCTCGQTEGLGWEANYCPYPNPDGDGCCGDTLLEQLEMSVEESSGGNGAEPRTSRVEGSIRTPPQEDESATASPSLPEDSPATETEGTAVTAARGAAVPAGDEPKFFNEGATPVIVGLSEGLEAQRYRPAGDDDE